MVACSMSLACPMFDRGILVVCQMCVRGILLVYQMFDYGVLVVCSMYVGGMFVAGAWPNFAAATRFELL